MHMQMFTRTCSHAHAQDVRLAETGRIRGGIVVSRVRVQPTLKHAASCQGRAHPVGRGFCSGLHGAGVSCGAGVSFSSKKERYDSVQFTRIADQLCGLSSIEIVATARVSGAHVCGLNYTGGWRGGRSCAKCNPDAKCANCRTIA